MRQWGNKMAVRKVKRTQAQVNELEDGLEFMRRYYPQFWERLTEDEICNFLEVTYAIFKANPEILAATNNPGTNPVQ